METFKKKIPVGILGATGIVGQKFVQLLHDHPWFTVVSLAASARSQGKQYGECTKNSLFSDWIISPCTPSLPCRLVFSALEATAAKDLEAAFASQGYAVISNSRAHRMKEHVPLLIPEVNPGQLEWIPHQHVPGMLVTNPNCSVIGIAMALKPLIDNWGVAAAHAVTLQAISGAGRQCNAIVDNVIPHIPNEVEKIENEPRKIFEDATIKISAQCNRVPVTDGHTICLSVQLKKKATKPELIQAWNDFRGLPQFYNLPTAPKQPIHYWENPTHPQPKLHRNIENGMALSIGGLTPCPVLDWKFVIHSHNLIRGAAGCAVLNAELMVQKGLI